MNLFKKIKALYEVEAPAENVEATEIKFKDVKAQDGSVLRITEDVVVGAKVEVINEDGTLSIPTSPEVTLEDGSVVSIDKDGIITDIKAAQAEENPEEEMEAPAEKPAEEAPAEAESNEVARIEALEAKVAELVNAVNGLIEALHGKESEMEAIKKENEELSKQASAPAANFKKFDKTTVEIKIQGPAKNDMLSRVLKRKEK